jgi:S-adenosylmethionine uptake transporter
VTAPPDNDQRRRLAANRRGAAFAMADMVLLTANMAIIKHAGSTIPSMQLAFFRASIGLVLVAPLLWRYRFDLLNTKQVRGHVGRIVCSAVALTCSYAAVAALPLTLVTAINFTRPFITLGLAALVLGEIISRRDWIALSVCFAGVLLITRPGTLGFDLGLLAAFGQVIFGSLAVIQMRQLAGEHAVVLMLFYTLGLTVLTAIPAGIVWVAPRWEDVPVLLAIALLAQIGQFCFLRANQLAEARYLAPLSYLSIVLSTLVDYLFFGLVPTLALIAGTSLIIATTLIGARLGKARV